MPPFNFKGQFLDLEEPVCSHGKPEDICACMKEGVREESRAGRARPFCWLAGGPGHFQHSWWWLEWDPLLL